MEKINISLYEWMEDFDNEELPDYRRYAELGNAVEEYNSKNNTEYNPITAYSNYLSWKRDKNKLDQ